MRQMHGLTSLIENVGKRLTIKYLAELLMEDLQDCHCLIYGRLQDESILLAKLSLAPGSLQYEMFDQRIDLALSGEITRDDCVPLTYRLQGQKFSITGRCSVLPRVCGVDWYIGGGYSGTASDQARLKFKIDVKEVFRQKTKD